MKHFVVLEPYHEGYTVCERLFDTVESALDYAKQNADKEYYYVEGVTVYGVGDSVLIDAAQLFRDPNSPWFSTFEELEAWRKRSKTTQEQT